MARRATNRIDAAERFGVSLHERSVGKLLRRLGFRRMSARPRHPKSDAKAQEAFANFAERVKQTFPEAAAGKPIEIWVQDEARVGQQGTLTRL